MHEEYGEGLVSFEYHTAFGLSTDETRARTGWYSISSVPTVRIDGLFSLIGADNCDAAAGEYRDRIDQRLQLTGGVSPVEIAGWFVPLPDSIEIEARFRLVDPVVLHDLRASLILYENDVLYREQHWQDVVRDIDDTTIQLPQQGSEVWIHRRIPVNPAWDVEQMHAAAYLQQTSSPRPVIQAALLPLGDFTLATPRRVASVRYGSGEAVFHASLRNSGSTADTLRVEIEEGAFGGWDSFLRLGDDPQPYHAPVDRILAPGETCGVHVHVRTGAEREARGGRLRVSSFRSTRSEARELRVVNAGRSILLVDDDLNRSDDAPIREALDACGILYDVWDSHYEHGRESPELDDMDDYDVVLWQTGFELTHVPLDRFDIDAVDRYLTGGGKLVLSSQQFLDMIPGPTSLTDHLGLATWTIDVGYASLEGVVQDPIGDGLRLELVFDEPYENQGDDARPAAGATLSLASPAGAGALIRRDDLPGGGRSVFVPAALHAVRELPDPDNLRTLLARILDWADPLTPAGVPGDRPAGDRRRRADLAVHPQPVRDGRACVVFDLSAEEAARPVRLELIDAGGRIARVALDDVLLPAGRNTLALDLDPGSGLLFLRLRTAAGVRGGRLLRLD